MPPPQEPRPPGGVRGAVAPSSRCHQRRRARAAHLEIPFISSISLLAFSIAERYAELVIRFTDGAPLLRDTTNPF